MALTNHNIGGGALKYAISAPLAKKAAQYRRRRPAAASASARSARAATSAKAWRRLANGGENGSGVAAAAIG